MATIKVTIKVSDIDDVIALFDQIKVYRSTTGVSGTYSELTGVGTRVDLVAGQSVYEYVDSAGDPAYYYKSSYFNSVSSAESSLSNPIQGSVDPLLVSLDDLRAEGVTIETADEERYLERIETWQAWIEQVTGLYFVPRQLTIDYDGTGTNLLQLPMPLVSLTYLYVNGDFDNAVDVDDFVAYTGRGGDDGRDDRRNPRVKLVTTESSIFTGVGPLCRTNAVFEVGEKNQRIEGTFGFVEPDGCAPRPIVYALKKLVVRTGKPLALSGGTAGPAGPVVEEETDRHRRKWGDPYSGAKAWPVSGDLEIDSILARYRRPMIVKGPRTMHGRGRRDWRL